MRFEIITTSLNGLSLIERKPRADARGSLTRVFCDEELLLTGWDRPIAQVNHASTRLAGTVRGMHFQYPPHAEMKLVTCLRGVVWDVAVDLRAGSASFLKWYAVELSAVNHLSLLIPEGFAHGYKSLSDDCELLYIHSTKYAPNFESGLNPVDPILSIDWPVAITDISHRDSVHPLLGSQFQGIVL